MGRCNGCGQQIVELNADLAYCKQCGEEIARDKVKALRVIAAERAVIEAATFVATHGTPEQHEALENAVAELLRERGEA
jgi:predicted amidophosphoribosyltransferase